MGKLWNRYKILGTNKYVYYIIKNKDNVYEKKQIFFERINIFILKNRNQSLPHGPTKIVTKIRFKCREYLCRYNMLYHILINSYITNTHHY